MSACYIFFSLPAPHLTLSKLELTLIKHKVLFLYVLIFFNFKNFLGLLGLVLGNPKNSSNSRIKHYLIKRSLKFKFNSVDYYTVNMFLLAISKKQLVVAIIIGMISFIGDMNFENQSNNLVAAIGDNVTHALIGVMTWIGAFFHKTWNTGFCFVFEVLLCGILSSIIDLDHFIAAKSFELKDATNLKGRPFMHCTTLVIVIIVTVLLLSYLLKMNWLFTLGWILAAAFLSHHIRDSKRRGFWIWPLGHTMPIPFLVQIICQMLFPYFLSIIASLFSPPEIFRDKPADFVESV